MSDRVVQSVNETSGKSIQPMQNYRSVWMSHWMRTSCKETVETLNLTSSASGAGEIGYGTKDDNLRLGLDVMRSKKVPGVTETRTSEMINCSPKMGTERLGFGSYIFKQSQKAGDMQAQMPVFGRNFERGKAVDIERGTKFPSMLHGVPYACDSFRRFHPIDEGTSKNPLEWLKDQSSAEESCFVALKPLQETVVESSLNVPNKHDLETYGSHKVKSEVSSLIGGADMVSKKQFHTANMVSPEHKSCNRHSQSTDLVCKEKNGGRPQSENYMNECFRESNASFLFDLPSTSSNRLPTFNQEWFQKMQNRSSLRQYPDHCIVSEETEAKKSYYNSYSMHKLPNCLHNVETMRICTTKEEGNLRGFPKFSQSLLITKTTDFNLSNEFDIFDTTRVTAEANGNIAGQGKRGVILELLSSSTESERKGYVGDVKKSKATIKNESSAETDTMDMDYFKEKKMCSGANSTPSAKAFNLNSNLSYPVDVSSSRETESPGPNTELPDINLELRALPAAAVSSESSGPSSSKTQSLEMDKLMAHAELSKPNSNICLGDSQNADPGNRWVKRLKLSSTQSFSQGTKSSNLAENSHDKKMKQYFRRILTNGITSSEPSPRKPHVEESMVLDYNGTLSKQNIENMVNSTKKNTESLLSQPWIQRWLHHGSRSTRDYPETTAICAPQSSKLAMEDHQKEPFPSIGAMALMGKAMRGFQLCDLQKKDSFTVWNTKNI